MEGEVVDVGELDVVILWLPAYTFAFVCIRLYTSPRVYIVAVEVSFDGAREPANTAIEAIATIAIIERVMKSEFLFICSVILSDGRGKVKGERNVDKINSSLSSYHQPKTPLCKLFHK